MHDEVSETENIRKNLSIERQIVEGCDMLLDVNQIFIRQGTQLSIFSFFYLFICLFIYLFIRILCNLFIFFLFVI